MTDRVADAAPGRNATNCTAVAVLAIPHSSYSVCGARKRAQRYFQVDYMMINQYAGSPIFARLLLPHGP
eukprot:TRINITY_DN697_c0_g1_i1.p1 TRINITY_DN697_c0_g1~~TRINITY_DN697_c0_g1_i1.p1  ORF type:complete len:69 (+),score=4.96 TRINITY_DN697_c0_g1_i1:78-284(+)